jgi:hypothetical protein
MSPSISTRRKKRQFLTSSTAFPGGGRVAKAADRAVGQMQLEVANDEAVERFQHEVGRERQAVSGSQRVPAAPASR